MDKQFILVVYDISNDRRRTKLHEALLDFGSPVQYSVFECLLEAKEVKNLKKRAAKIIHPKTDNLRYYYLCQNCLGKVETTSGPEVLREHPQAVVV
jgi:CRISPR-associated protein Cas2